MIRRVARFACSARLSCTFGRRGRDGDDPPVRDVLWRAKCNALHRALADHGLSALQVSVILCRLSGARGHGCELTRLGLLTGIDPGVLDRAVPLLGLQNFITVSESSPRGGAGPVLWVFVTEHGFRYAAEASAKAYAEAPGACGAGSEKPL